jgi:large subunit ribosomal protein L24
MYRALNSYQTKTAAPVSQYARFQPNLSFYFPYSKRPVLKYLPFGRNYFRTPNVDKKFLTSVYADKTVDYTEKEQMDESEAMRGPRERDFYQDHTYHDQWIERELTDNQTEMLASRYSWMVPGYEIKPWLWFPGDIVEVVSGPFAGQRGTILNIMKYKNECFVQNVNVQPIVIPASESRPEQTIQREHPISVKVVKIVDPQTNEPCDVKFVQVRDKETKQVVERRMSLSSGALLPLPKNQETVETGDPMYDTPLEDAEEPTYMEEKELPMMVERKLRAMEDHFVESLKKANAHHDKYRRSNEHHLRLYQQQVVRRAANAVQHMALRGELKLDAAALREATKDVSLPGSDDDAYNDDNNATASESAQ